MDWKPDQADMEQRWGSLKAMWLLVLVLPQLSLAWLRLDSASWVIFMAHSWKAELINMTQSGSWAAQSDSSWFFLPKKEISLLPDFHYITVSNYHYPRQPHHTQRQPHHSQHRWRQSQKGLDVSPLVFFCLNPHSHISDDDAGNHGDDDAVIFLPFDVTSFLPELSLLSSYSCYHLSLWSWTIFTIIMTPFLFWHLCTSIFFSELLPYLSRYCLLFFSHRFSYPI